MSGSSTRPARQNGRRIADAKTRCLMRPFSMSSTVDCIITAVIPISTVPRDRRRAATAETGVKIYLACTVRGDRGGLLAVRALAALLERRGHTVMTHHLLSDDVDTAESALSEREVFERDVPGWTRPIC